MDLEQPTTIQEALEYVIARARKRSISPSRMNKNVSMAISISELYRIIEKAGWVDPNPKQEPHATT